MISIYQIKKSIILTIAILAIGLTINAQAQSVSFTAEVDTNKIELGGAFQLSLAVSGVENIPGFNLPEIEGLNIRSSGSSTNITMINGHYEKSRTFTFSLFPMKVGFYEIPSFTAEIDGKTYSTEAISVEVVDTPGPVNNQIASSGQVPDSANTSIKDKLFLVVKTDKNKVYLGESLLVKIYLYVNGVSVRDPQMPRIEGVGFTVGEFDKRTQFQQIVEGVRYDVVEHDVFLYPTRTGTLELGPIKLDCNLLVKNNQQTNRRSFGSFFDDEFFEGIFDSYRRVPMTVESGKGVINVLELPQEGKPDDFSGGVGSYDFNVQVSPTDVKEGDPITLKMNVTGQGNINAVNFPKLKETNEIKLYEPQISQNNGDKILEQVLIPRSKTLTEIPAIKFSYFDSESGEYKTITRGPFPINVQEREGDIGLRIIGGDSKNDFNVEEELGSDIVFIKSEIGNVKPIGIKKYKQPSFYIIIVCALILWFFGYVYYLRNERLKTDVVYAKRKHAPKYAKKQIAKAKNFLVSEDKHGFYDCIYKTLKKYFSNKFHMPVGTVSFESVIDRCRISKADSDVLNNIKAKLKRIFEECDIVRYAAGQISHDIMQNSFEDLEEIIDFYERKF
ncbi:MAG: BatD family protein [Candidatus Omnitrophica bacterium]|nr:BatD family protein [Candidatus Omnitrophota bacterium]MBU1996304.1 BatD family protein [Candidatus Omnitrophota bacterium]MBU4332817.1 BatD family protein [Candidatus Omnitrophota bacterium]